MRLVTSNYRTLTILLYFQEVKQKKKYCTLQCQENKVSNIAFSITYCCTKLKKKTFRENTFRKGHVYFQ